MHEVFKIKSLKSILKFQQKLNNFEKPPKLFKNPKPRSKCMKSMKNGRKRDHTKWFEAKKGRQSRGFEGFEKDVSVWEVRRRICWESSKKVRKKSRTTLK